MGTAGLLPPLRSFIVAAQSSSRHREPERGRRVSLRLADGPTEFLAIARAVDRRRMPNPKPTSGVRMQAASQAGRIKAPRRSRGAAVASPENQHHRSDNDRDGQDRDENDVRKSRKDVGAFDGAAV
jgi:hypothetical protein